MKRTTIHIPRIHTWYQKLMLGMILYGKLHFKVVLKCVPQRIGYRRIFNN